MTLTKLQLEKQEELRLHELAIVAEHETFFGKASLEQAYNVIVADRLGRWKEILEGMKIPEGLRKWAARMSSVYGPEVLMHRKPNLSGYMLDWLTALLVVRYGEAEYFWPTEFGKEDMERALTWMQGKKTPGMITYIPKEG